ncbi:MAG TPA: NUDIX hydrolase [Candidatus Saccharimonadales bacterium]|nr:NUDIX hydrolase [Candidatus Saccharimonadales bacterium]
MKKLWQAIGILAFWAAWPLLFLYLGRSERTRVLVLCGGEALVLKSWLGSGRWSLPGGGLHKGESPAIGLARELHEETGVTLAPSAIKPLVSEPFKQWGFKYHCHYFVVELSTRPPVRKQPFEIADYQWLPLHQLSGKKIGLDVTTAVKAWSRQHDLIQ